MKKRRIVLVLVVVLIALFAAIKFMTDLRSPLADLSYNSKNSMHYKYSIEKNVVIIVDTILVKNNTDKDLFFYMYADSKENKGLVTEDFVPACKQDSQEKEKFFIKAKSQASFVAYFKSPKGDKTTKFDRAPPDSIKFEIVE